MAIRFRTDAVAASLMLADVACTITDHSNACLEERVGREAASTGTE